MSNGIEDDDESILQEFLVECSEGVERLDQEFVSLEKEPTNASLIGSIFRTVHTIKGTCGFLGLPNLEKVSHGAENILSEMRDNTIPVTEEGITILLEAVDAIKEILEHIESYGEEGNKNYDELRKHLDAYLKRTEYPKAAPSSNAIKAPAKKTPAKKNIAKKKDIRKDDKIIKKPVETKTPGETTKTPKIRTRSLTDATIRVDVELLDQLINMVGELVLARNQLLQQVRGVEKGPVSDANNGTLQQINLITTELQDTVMKTRMQPIKNVWDKFPRVVRDLARANGKEIDVVMEGNDTELDKTLLEAIKDPMTHIVRNAADHGIELPKIRGEMGKPAKGTLCLKAFHEGGQINIEITDDGAGIDVEKVKEKAIENGLITADTASRMSSHEGLRLIFHPGLSTAKKVTKVSGRGVGMDVVKTNIERIGGNIDMLSTPGEGTQMRIKIPLTLAIIPALMVTSGGEPFAIPQASLLELVRVDSEDALQVEEIRGVEFYRLRGHLLPLIRLNKVLKLNEKSDQEESQTRKTSVNIVILKALEQIFGLVVDMVNDSEEIVVKPLSRHLKGLSYLAGATIMGNGRVALILDVVGISQAGGLQREVLNDTSDHTEEEIGSKKEKETLILFTMADKHQYAIPLSQVARLEEFNAGDVEQSAGIDVIQYRGELLPLIQVGGGLDGLNLDESRDYLQTIIFSKANKTMGLIVDNIIDIVSADMNLQSLPLGKEGVIGSLVINGITTDVLDLNQIAESIVPGWFEAIPA
ncbi:MAG: chemotaxis protein CheW [Nitrospiria bacterium]